MRFRNLILSAVLICLLSACTSSPESDSSPYANGRPVGAVRGTLLVNKQIQRRLLDTSVDSTDYFQIEQVAGDDIYNMRGLLGEYSEGGAHAEFRGGEPNPFGMLLWYQVAARFAEGLGGICQATPGDRTLNFFSNGTFFMSAAFAAKLSANCDRTLAEADLKANASSLWRSVIGIGADAEQEAWTGFFTDANSGFVPGGDSERISAMVLAMILNPHFLLEK